jgi:hypothetical protein
MSAMQKVMAKESLLGISLFVTEWVVTALVPALIYKKALCSISS